MGGLKRGQLALLAVLSIGLAACGGSSSAPPPVPPAPAPVSVTLGQHGGTITLQSQGGRYTLNGATVTNGAEVEGSNGQTYRLTLANGQWSAQYVPPDPVVIPLGTSGGEVELDRSEDGTYRAGATTVESGDTVTTLNGSTYRLTLSDGEWQAAYEPPDPATVQLGASGDEVTLVRNEDGTFQAGAVSLESGGTVQSSNGGVYRLTLRGGEWQAAYEPPDPAVLTLGASGDEVIVTRNEDGSFMVGDARFESGGVIIATNGSGYRLTLGSGRWRVVYAPPPPATVALGASGDEVIVTRNEDGSFMAGDARFESGGVIIATNGSGYRLTLGSGRWRVVYAPPPPATVALGASGDEVIVTRNEDGSFMAGDARFESGGVIIATNGSGYRLTLGSGRWLVVYAPPPPATVALGASGEQVTITRNEAGVYSVNGFSFQPGGTWTTRAGARYRLSLADGQWSAAFVPSEVALVPLGTSGESLSVNQLEDGRFEVGGELLVSGSTREASNGNVYRITLVAGQWTAEYVPAQVAVELGSTGSLLTLVREEDGRYWLGRVVIESGDTHTASNGDVYRLRFSGGQWSATFVPETIRVEAGDSGNALVILRLEDGSFWLGSRQIFSGDTVVQDGNEYVLTRSGRTWTARFRAGTVRVDLPLGGSITLVKREDGTYTWNGRVIRSGSTYTINGARYRLTLGADGWRAVRRTFVTDPGDRDPDPPNRDSGESDEIEQRLGGSDLFGLRDADDSSRGTQGTHLVVGPTDNEAMYMVEDLLDRDVVREARTYAQAAREMVETVIDTIRRFTAIYEIDEDFLGDPSLGLAAQWARARGAVERIPGGHVFPSAPWRSSPDSGDIDDAIEDLEFVAEALSGRSAFEDEFGSDEGFDQLLSKLVFGSTDSARFGAFANRRSDGSWDTGHFAYSPDAAPESAEVPRQGGATYRGDTVAVYDDGTEEPQTFTGTMDITATFSTGTVQGTVTELLDDEDEDFEYDGGSLTSIVLPEAVIADPDSGDRGSFTVDGMSTLRLSRAPDVERTTSFDGQFVDVDEEVFGTWQVELDGSSETLSGAFGLDQRTDNSVDLSFVDSTGHRVQSTVYPRAVSSRETTVQGATDSQSNRDFTIAFSHGDIAFTASPGRLNLRSGRSSRHDIEHPDGLDVGNFWIESTDVTRFGAWAIASRSNAPVFASTGGAAFAYSPLEPAPSGSVADLRFTAEYRGGVRAVVHDSTSFTIFSGNVEADIAWNVGSDDDLEVRLYDFERITGSSDLLLDKEVFFEDSAELTHEQFETTSISVDSSTASGSMAIRLVGNSVDGPVGMLGGWLAEIGGVTAEGSFGADLQP